jgi:hypothetical protein
MKLGKFFDRVFVINLPERTDRRRAIVRELERAGLPLEPGRVEIFPAIRPDGPAGFPSLGARGCFLSHRACLARARDEGARNVLVVEDDLVISPRVLADGERIAAELSSRPWDFAYLGHVLEVEKEGPLTFQPFAGDIVTAHFVAFNGPLLFPLVGFLDALLARAPGDPEGGPMHVDGAYGFYRFRNPAAINLVAVPNLGWQRASRSDIAGGKWWDDVPGLSQLAGLARSVKTSLKSR